MKKYFLIISVLLFLSFSSHGQVFKIVFNQPDQLLVYPGSDTLICPNHSVVLGGQPTAAGGTEQYLYSWSPAENLDDPTSPNPVATLSESTKFFLTVTDANGCSVIDFVHVNVDFCLGIEDQLSQNDILIYPNPTTGEITLSGLLSEGQNIQISLLNSLGAEVLSPQLQEGSDSIHLDLLSHGLPKGLYFFRITTNNGVKIRKIQLI